MNKSADTSNKTENPSYKNAHFFNEFAQMLLKAGNDIENSVTVFDAIGTKNETFTKLEESMLNPMDSFINMQNISQEQIFQFVFNGFEKTFLKYKENFNFIHYAFYDHKSISFFISPKDENTKDNFEKLEYDFFTGDISKYLDLSFCFVEEDMEKDLINTKKLELVN